MKQPETDHYYAVIFTSTLKPDADGYDAMSAKMLELVQQQPGFLGFDSARESSGTGITVSYWQDLQSIRHWRDNLEHQAAQRLGKERWYEQYSIRIAKIEREYGSATGST